MGAKGCCFGVFWGVGEVRKGNLLSDTLTQEGFYALRGLSTRFFSSSVSTLITSTDSSHSFTSLSDSGSPPTHESGFSL